MSRGEPEASVVQPPMPRGVQAIADLVGPGRVWRCRGNDCGKRWACAFVIDGDVDPVTLTLAGFEHLPADKRWVAFWGEVDPRKRLP